MNKQADKKNRRSILLPALLVLTSIILLALSASYVYALSQCSDGADNDCDGKVDMADNGCSGVSDNSENIITGYAKGCLSYGQTLKSPCGVVHYTCDHDLCQACIMILERGAYTTLESHCYGLPACGFSDGDNSSGGFDTAAPTITISNPLEGSIQISRSVYISIAVDEASKLQKYDALRQSWVTLCERCGSYSKALNYYDGENELLIKATDRAGNSVEKTVGFFVDSKAPRISKTFPKTKKFASGEFIVIYDENNVKEMILHYGNLETGQRTATLLGCSSGKKQECSIDVDLTDYDGSNIDYYFTLTDIADNSVNSKTANVNVDISPPVINWLLHREAGRYSYFNISVSDANFDEILYWDNYDSRPRWRKICSALKNGACVKKLSFAVGDHLLDIQVFDDAGNSIAEQVGFTINY